MTDLQEHIDNCLAQGFKIAQQGRVLVPLADPAKLSFAERVEGFDIRKLGTYSAPTWRSQFDNRLFDDRERWVHLRRVRAS